MTATAITSRKVTVWQVGGKGKCFRSKPAAYRRAAFALVQAKCMRLHGVDDWREVPTDTPCRYCSKLCDGGRLPRGERHYDDQALEYGSCEGDPTHSYRYRLVGRLARWLRWRDERAGKAGA